MKDKTAHTLLYDGNCPFCLGIIDRWRGTLESRGFALAPLQTDWVRNRLSMPEEELLKEMRLLTADEKVFGGVDAYMFIWREIWWCYPFWFLAHVPGVRFLMDIAYRWVAKNRMCLSGACSLTNESRFKRGFGIPGWFPLLILVGAAIYFRNHFPEKWMLMWALAFAIYFGCKWLTLTRSWSNGSTSGFGHSLGYLFLWPGMDAKPFMDCADPPERPVIGEWLAAVFKFFLGGFILWGVAPMIGEFRPVLAAWMGMLGIILILHFGSFHLAALAWRSLGVVAEPLMRSPALSTSLSVFWSERWNRGFNQLAHDLVFRITYRRFGVGAAIMLVFLISGLVHDLVISLPAGVMFGLPTAYFIIQGIGVLIERSRHGRRMGLRAGAKGWVFMCAFTVGPAYWLFHEPFILNVILPFLKAIGAL